MDRCGALVHKGFTEPAQDNRGQKWGYRFDGEGGMVKLKGKAQARATTRGSKKQANWRPAVKDVIENEGFDYGFRHYTSFKEVKDAKFH